MNKYFVLYRIPVETMREWRKTTSHEDMKTQGSKIGQEMMAWGKKNEKSIVDRGQPLGKTKSVTKDGVKDAANDLNYYCIVEAESHEEAAKLFADNPHVLTIPSSYIDVMEIPHMGM